MEELSLIFIGTGAFGAPILETLARDARIKILFVITGQNKPLGRKLQFTKTPIKNAAIANKLIIHQPARIQELKQKLIEEKPDFLLVVSYGEIIKKDILKIPKFGAINIHASLLPKYRGASPIQETILQGDIKTGITWILMNEKMDAGDIIEQKKIVIAQDDTSETLAQKLSTSAAKETPEILLSLAKNPQTKKQNEHKATYCRKIKKEDGLLDSNKQTAQQIQRKIRAYTPWPGCFIFWNNKRIKIVQAQLSEQKISSGEIKAEGRKKLLIGTIDGTLEVLLLQPEAKRVMSAEEFLRGLKNHKL